MQHKSSDARRQRRPAAPHADRLGDGVAVGRRVRPLSAQGAFASRKEDAAKTLTRKAPRRPTSAPSVKSLVEGGRAGRVRGMASTVGDNLREKALKLANELREKAERSSV